MSTSSTELTRVFERRLTGLTALVNLTCQLAAERDLDRILSLVTHHVCEALGCERASLFLYDEETRELFTRVATELEIDEIRHSVDLGISGWVARHREVVNVPQPALDARWNSSFDRETGFHTENIMAAPLISKHDSRLVGVLQLLNKQGSPFDQFDEHLLLAFAAHAGVALEQARMLEEIRGAESMQASIELARRIQSSFLPTRLPELPGYEFSAGWQPAEAVAGDYFDLLPLPDGRWAVALADVSGHGVGPSLIVATARAMLHILARTQTEPEQILTLLSETIAPDLKDGMFVTFFLGALELLQNRMSFANAGHFPALHYQFRTGEFQTLARTGPPLGAAPEIPFPPPTSVSFELGDILLLATDGAIEQHNAAGEMFGVARLQETAKRHAERSARGITESLMEALRKFCGNDHPDDDVTLFVIKRSQGAPALTGVGILSLMQSHGFS